MEEINNQVVEKKRSSTKISIYQALPSDLRRRIRALRKLQISSLQNDAKFHYDAHQLECQYQDATNKIFKKRAKIVKGKVEPTDKDCSMSFNEDSPDEDDPIMMEEREKFRLTRHLTKCDKGIPGFWLNVMKSSELTAELVTARDEPILEHLVDAAVVLGDQLSFTIKFEFSQNPYFRNKVLSKEFEMKWDGLLGGVVRTARGCPIDWEEGMDVTREVTERKAVSWVAGKGRVVHPHRSTIRTDSFFNFFDTLPEEEDGTDEVLAVELRYVRNMELMLGLYFREELIPKAVLYYTGDLIR